MPLKKILFVAMLFAGSPATAQTTSPPHWKRVGPSGSFGYAVDLNSISRPLYPGDNATALICFVMKDNCSLSNTIKWQFDCRGYYKAIDGSGKGMINVPPNSAPSEVAAIVCAESANEGKAANTRKLTSEESIAAALIARSSPAMREYIANMRVAAENYGHAFAAVTCQLRSAAWLRTFDSGYQLFAAQEAGRLNLSTKERQEIEIITTPAFNRAAYVENESTCQKLVNSPLMRELDRLHSQLTGGYQ